MESKKNKKMTYFMLMAMVTVGSGFTPIMIQNHTVHASELLSTKTINSFILNDWTYTQDSDSITLTKYNGTETSIYVPGEYNGKRVFITDFKIFPSTMKGLTLEEVNGVKVGLKTVDLSRSFSQNRNITSLNLSGLDTSNVTNMSRMFADASNLTSLDVSNWDTSNVTDMNRMFSSARSLTNLNLNHWDTSNVTDMDSIFYGVSNLTSLDVSDWDTSSVTDMSYMFSGARSLTTLNLNHWDTSNVTSMHAMFYGASKLTTLNIGNWDTSNVTDMEMMFEDVTQLATLDVSRWDVSNVIDMERMFTNMKSLTTLDVSNWDTSNVTDMEKMFMHDINLTTLDVSNWDTSSVTDMERMFLNMASLQTLDLSKWDVSKVANMEKMFAWLPQITTLDLSNWKISEGTKMSKMFDVGVDIQAPLFIVTEDNRLKNYNFRGDYRTGVRLSYLTNGGQFSNGATECSSKEIFVINNTDDSYIQSIVDAVEVPTREGYVFEKWIDTKTINATTPLEEAYQRLNTTYKAQWRSPNVAPTIEAQDVLIHVGDVFNPLDHASAHDDEDGEIILDESNVIFNNVDTSTPGVYQVTYEVTDQAGATVSKSITVTVNGLPVIEVENVTINKGDTFNPLDNVTVLDPEDGEIMLNESNVIFNNVDTSTAGSYEVTYEVTDSHGATVTKTITVIVRESSLTTDETDDETEEDMLNPDAPSDVVEDDTINPDAPSDEAEEDMLNPNAPSLDNLDSSIIENQPISDKDIIETGLSNQITLLIGLFSLLQGLVFWKRKN